MTEKEYLKMLGQIPASRINKITYAVNCKVKKSEIGLKGEVEEMYYDRLIKQAESHEKKYGFWPTFDMQEMETDDPALDIYGKSV